MAYCYLDNLQINGFRGLQDLELKELGRFNLLVGENNSGKTSVLEALAILSDPLDLAWWNRVAGTRDYSRGPAATIENLEWLFHHSQGNLDSQAPLEFQLHVNGTSPVRSLIASIKKVAKQYVDEDDEGLGAKHTRLSRVASASTEISGLQFSMVLDRAPRPGSLPFTDLKAEEHKITVWDTDRMAMLATQKRPLFPTSISPPYFHRAKRVLAAAHSESVPEGRKANLLAVMQLFDPKISDYTTVVNTSIRQYASTWLEYEHLGWAPLQIFGDGVQSVMNLAYQLQQASGGLLLIDEIDTALHTSVIPRIVKWVIDAARESDVQVYATTHSVEVVDALLARDVEAEDSPIVVHRLQSKDGKTSAKRLDHKHLMELRGEMGLEVR